MYIHLFILLLYETIFLEFVHQKIFHHKNIVAKLPKMGYYPNDEKKKGENSLSEIQRAFEKIAGFLQSSHFNHTFFSDI